MSYDIEKARLGGEPLITCKLTMDYCALVAGVGACTATETGDAKCYNTRASCNDTANYDKSTKDYTFCQPRSSLPIGEPMFPVIMGTPQKASTSTTAGSGLGKRAVVKIKLADFVHHDRGIDPYHNERTYDAVDTGTFWGKWLTRNPYYEGRTISIGYGYISPDGFSANDFEYQKYDITDIDGVKDKNVTITAKDVLVRTYDRKSQFPVLSEGALLADIAIGATSATLSPTGIGNSDYPSSGTLSIGKEAMTFTRSGDTLTIVREQWGTENKAHKAGDTVQICEVFNENIVDALDRILTTGAGLPSSYIPTADWDGERDLWLSNATVYGILMKPESIEKVIGEWSEVFMFDIWWDAVNQEIKLKALSPEPSGETINTLSESYDILEGSLKIDRKSKSRFTEIRVGYNKIDYSEKNDNEQFATWQHATDPSRAGADRYNGNSIKTILCRWFISQSNALQLAGRLLARFSDTPEIITFKLDQKDHGKVEVAGRVEIDSWQFQDFSGANEARKFQVLEINEGNSPSENFTVKALTSSFTGRYFFIAPNSTPDYSSATEAQKESYGFISLSTGDFSDGSEADKII